MQTPKYYVQSENKARKLFYSVSIITCTCISSTTLVNQTHSLDYGQTCTCALTTCHAYIVVIATMCLLYKTMYTAASLYGETGRYKESEEMFKKAMKINPTYAEAYFNLGKLEVQKSEALSFYLFFYNAVSFRLGTLYVQMGRLEDGEKHLKDALKLNPHHHGAMNNLRVVEHQRKTQKKQT